MRNGTGGYQLPANSWNPAVNGVAATAADWNSTAQDIQAAIQQSVSSDGQTPMVGNLNMNGNKITGLANASASGDAVSLGRLDEADGASLSGYLPAGTGAVQTNVGDQLLKIQRWTINVQDAPFYAKGDGVTDDTAAIQAAINFLNPNAWSASFNYQQGGGTLVFPKGIYRITSPIYVTPYVILQGAGRDGWTGGGLGLGVSAGGADATTCTGSAIFADFGPTVTTCAINTANRSISTGELYPASNMTLLDTVQFGGAYSYCQGVGIRDLAVYCLNDANVGIRLQPGGLVDVQNVSCIGFKVPMVLNNSWTSKLDNLFILGKQISFYAKDCNSVAVSGCFDGSGWGSSNGSTITNNNIVTALNKPAGWSANDTNYNSTSLYVYNCTAMSFPDTTCQHVGRILYAENSDVRLGTVYIEDVPFLASGSTTGCFNGYNSVPGDNSILIEQATFLAANGCTVFNSLINTPVTLLQKNGLIGMMYGPIGTSQLLIGNNVNRNGAFGDYAFDSRIINTVPEVGTWTPSLTNISGTGITAVGKWVKSGNLIDVVISITGTGITATGGGASIISTPFGSPGFPSPARASAASVATPDMQVVSALMQNNANLYLGSVTSTTQIVISFQYWAV